MKKISLLGNYKKLSCSFQQVIICSLILVISVSACQKENSFFPLPIPEQQLASIEYLTDNSYWSEEYLYDIYDRLIRVDNLRSTGRRYELSYEKERLSEVKTYKILDDKLIFRDELEYDNDGRIYKTYNYSINGGETLPLARIHEYLYNVDGLIVEKLTYGPTDDKVIRSEKYFWENGNIVNIAHHDGNGNLEYEFSYKYDQSFNYNIYQTHRVNQFMILNQNNIIQEELIKDCTGLVDIFCSPCASDFTYDSNKYPIAVETSYRSLKIIYE